MMNLRVYSGTVLAHAHICLPMPMTWFVGRLGLMVIADPDASEGLS